MKKLFTLILVCTISFLSAQTIEKTYYFSAPKLIKSGQYATLHFKNTQQQGIPGEPVLPYHAISLLLPPGTAAAEIEVIREEPVIFNEAIILAPRQYAHTYSGNEPRQFIKTDAVYQQHLYPEHCYGKVSTQTMNGYSFALSAVTPVEYHPAESTITWYRSITVRITPTSSMKGELALANLSHSPRVMKEVQDIAQNPKMADQYPSSSKSDEAYDYLIITPQQFADKFDNLRALYTKEGLENKLATIETIQSSGTGADLQEKIRNYIINEYQTSDISYVMLAGDVEHVPYRGFYCQVQSSSVMEDSNIPSDLYYSALDGTWNNNNNDKWGEIGEDDLMPEIAVARICFSSATELDNILHKTINYQTNPVLGELRNPLMAGEHLYDDPLTYGSDYMELLIGHHEDNGYTTDGIPEDQNFTKMYDKNSAWTASALIQEINEGHSFIHHSGHSNWNYAMRLSNSDITNNNFSQVDGVTHNYTLVYTHGCICGAFDENDCIAEHMIQIEKFCVAGAFNTRYGWFNEGQTEGPSAHLHREFMHALYTEKTNRIGMTHLKSRVKTIPWVNAPGQHEEGALRWCYYDCNIQGDPALAIWTDEPLAIEASYPPAIPLGTTSVEVTVTHEGTPIEGANCVIKGEETVNGSASTNASGVATITLSPAAQTLGELELVISGYNILPVTKTITVIPGSSSYIVYTAHTINDGNNGIAETGEDIVLGTTMKNMGSVDANNITVQLSTDDSYINITDNSADFGTIAATTTSTQADAFSFTIAPNIPDGHSAHFTFTATDGTTQWTSAMNLEISAPDLTIASYTIDDNEGGNGNGYLDAGEEAKIIINCLNNGHSVASATTAQLASTCDKITIAASSINLDNITAGQTVSATFNIIVASDASDGTLVPFTSTLQSGSYTAQKAFTTTIGIQCEDFETGDFNQYAWQHTGNSDWSIISQDPYAGTYSARSGNIGNNANSTLSIVLNVMTNNDSISFYRKTSSEDGYDYLNFKIDGVIVDKWSGEKPWQRLAYEVPQGSHTFQWEYSKDSYSNGGSDATWLDNITFPPCDFGSDELAVSVTSSPQEICAGEASQLNAFATGGSGNYTYVWTPSTGLSATNIANPIATPSTTTTYQIAVNDGNNTVSKNTEVIVHPVPETPVISIQGEKLVSSSPEGNQWYDENGMISGSNAQEFTPIVSGTYHVIVTNVNGCTSTPSNSIYYEVIGINENIGINNIAVSPCPFHSDTQIIISSCFTDNIKLIIFDIFGKAVIVKENIPCIPGDQKINIDGTSLAPGAYFGSISGNKISGEFKMIKQ